MLFVAKSHRAPEILGKWIRENSCAKTDCEISEGAPTGVGGDTQNKKAAAGSHASC